MAGIEGMTNCDVLLLPERGGARAIATLRGNVSLVDALRYVAEELASQQRERTVIRTPVRNVFAAEAAELYALFGQRPEGRQDGMFSSAA